MNKHVILSGYMSGLSLIIQFYVMVVIHKHLSLQWFVPITNMNVETDYQYIIDI